MSYYNSNADSKNPFGEEERQPTEQERIVSQILDVQNESKSTTQRSLALLYQTEEVGTATAEQLTEQGEQLDRIEGTVKKIDEDLKDSQKHINGLKSIFGGVTNWWQARKEKKKSAHPEPEVCDSNLRSAMKQSGGAAAKPATRSGGQSSAKINVTVAGTSVQDVLDQNEQDIEDDLDQMSALTDRLKFMAVAMGEEMEKQNDQIERITDRTGRTESRMTGQTSQLNKILKN